MEKAGYAGSYKVAVFPRSMKKLYAYKLNGVTCKTAFVGCFYLPFRLKPQQKLCFYRRTTNISFAMAAANWR